MANLDQSFIKAYGQDSADNPAGRMKASPDVAVNVADWYSATVVDTSNVSELVTAESAPAGVAAAPQSHTRNDETSGGARRVVRRERNDKPDLHIADQAAALRPMARRYGAVRAAEAAAVAVDNAPSKMPSSDSVAAAQVAAVPAPKRAPAEFRDETFAVDSLNADVRYSGAARAPRPTPAPVTEAPSLCHRACTVQFTAIGGAEIESTLPAPTVGAASITSANRVLSSATPAPIAHAPESVGSPIAKRATRASAPTEPEYATNVSMFKPIGPGAGETAIHVTASSSVQAASVSNTSVSSTSTGSGAPYATATHTAGTKPQPVAGVAYRPVAPSTIEAVPFQPGFEVDQFRWPSLVSELGQKSTTALSGMIDELVNASSAGRGRVMFAGGRRGAGVTTLALYVARRAAELGLSVALVDGDFAKPAVARSLGVGPTQGFEDVLAGRSDLCGALIASVADRLTLLPLRGSCFDLAQTNATHIAAHLATLQRHFALVIVDGGPLADCAEPWLKTAGENAIDSGIIVHDVRHDLATRNAHRPSPTYPAIGVVENFVR